MHWLQAFFGTRINLTCKYILQQPYRNAIVYMKYKHEASLLLTVLSSVSYSNCPFYSLQYKADFYTQCGSAQIL